jgi:hypothetical protein
LIRAAFQQHGELPASVELRRRFPGITDNQQQGSPPGNRPVELGAP